MKHLEEVIINYDKKLMEANAEIERLTELCNKYEEEHKTTFETWQKDIKENKKLHSIIKEIREYIEEKKYDFCDDYDLRDENGKDLLEILKGSDKE